MLEEWYMWPDSFPSNKSQFFQSYFGVSLDMNGSTFNHSDMAAPQCWPNSAKNLSTYMPQTEVSPSLIRMRIIVDVYIVSLLCLVGFIGNALSIAVLYRDNDKRNTTTWLLQTLAVVDTLYLLACVFIQPLHTIRENTDWVPGLKTTFPYMSPYIWVGASITQTITVWTVMLVTLDRYIAICKPFKTQLRSLERAKMTFAVIVVFAVLYNIPRCFERKIVTTLDHCGNKVISSGHTELRSNRVYFLVYKTILFFIFRSIGPLVALIVFNCMLIRALQLRWHNKDLSRTTRHRENITLMLVVVVAVFIVCEMPDLLLRITYTIADFRGGINHEYKELLRKVNSISNMLLTVNSSINFLIYCLVGKKFRRILMNMAPCAFHAKPSEVSETEPLTSRTTYNNATTMTVSRMSEAEPLTVSKATDTATNGSVRESDQDKDVDVSL